MPPVAHDRGGAWIVKPRQGPRRRWRANAPARRIAWGGDGVQVGFPVQGGWCAVARRAAATSATAQRYQRGQACWEDTPCPSLKPPSRGQSDMGRCPLQDAPAASKAQTGGAGRPCRAVKPDPYRTGAERATLLQIPDGVSRTRRCIAPRLPRCCRRLPGVSHRLRSSRTRWSPAAFGTGPGATDCKMPQVAGFEPLIDPSQVISW
jgi:hypothetical protein